MYSSSASENPPVVADKNVANEVEHPVYNVEEERNVVFMLLLLLTIMFVVAEKDDTSDADNVRHVSTIVMITFSLSLIIELQRCNRKTKDQMCDFESILQLMLV